MFHKKARYKFFTPPLCKDSWKGKIFNKHLLHTQPPPTLKSVLVSISYNFLCIPIDVIKFFMLS